MREAFAMQKLLILFQQKILAYLRYFDVWYNETFPKNVVSFEQLGQAVIQICLTLQRSFENKSYPGLKLPVSLYSTPPPAPDSPRTGSGQYGV